MEISRHSHNLPDTFTHVHAVNYEIMYCITGSYLFHYEQADHVIVRNIVCKPKTMIFIPKNVPHGLRVLQYPYERYFIQFSDRTMVKTLSESTLLSIFSQKINPLSEAELVPRFLDVSSTSTKIESMLDEIYGSQFSLDMDDNWKRVYQNSQFSMLLCKLYLNYRNFFSQSLAQYTKPVQTAKHIIDTHYDLPLTMQALASQCFLSPNYLSKIFHAQVGMSPRQYLTKKRLFMAQKLLCSTQLTIQEIAMETGFGDVNYFIKHFKTAYGTTPKQYRKTMEERILG